MPIATVPRKQATAYLRNTDFDTLEMEMEYEAEELAGLEQRVRHNFSVEATKHTFNLPQVSSEEIQAIVFNLQNAKEAIADRVVNVKTESHEFESEEDDSSDKDNQSYNFHDGDDEDEDF